MALVRILGHLANHLQRGLVLQLAQLVQHRQADRHRAIATQRDQQGFGPGMRAAGQVAGGMMADSRGRVDGQLVGGAILKVGRLGQQSLFQTGQGFVRIEMGQPVERHGLHIIPGNLEGLEIPGDHPRVVDERQFPFGFVPGRVLEIDHRGAQAVDHRLGRGGIERLDAGRNRNRGQLQPAVPDLLGMLVLPLGNLHRARERAGPILFGQHPAIVPQVDDRQLVGRHPVAAVANAERQFSRVRQHQVDGQRLQVVDRPAELLDLPPGGIDNVEFQLDPGPGNVHGIAPVRDVLKMQCGRQNQRAVEDVGLMQLEPPPQPPDRRRPGRQARFRLAVGRGGRGGLGWRRVFVCPGKARGKTDSGDNPAHEQGTTSAHGSLLSAIVAV